MYAPTTYDPIWVEKCADSLVGNLYHLGVSGGERKRRVIGMELVTRHGMLHEPTTGLDSRMADLVVKALRS